MSRRATFWTVQLIGWGAFGINHYLASAPELLDIEKLPVFLIKMAFSVLGLCFSSLLYAVYTHLLPRSRDTISLVLSAIVVCFLFGFAWHFIYRLTLPPPFGGLDVIVQLTFVVEAVNNIFVLLAWSTAYFGLKFWRDSRIQAQAAAEARALAHEAQLKALQYQLNPHFLFNALNSVRALTREDRGKANEMVTQLAEFLRHALTGTPLKEKLLQDEVEALRKYLSIEQIRFEDRLDVVIKVDRSARGCLIPGLLVHPLLENAIKHGMRTSAMPLQVALKATTSNGQLSIEVANTGRFERRGSETNEDGVDTGIGLANVRERLARAYPDRHEFAVYQDGDWVRAVIKIDQKPTGYDAS